MTANKGASLGGWSEVVVPCVAIVVVFVGEDREDRGRDASENWGLSPPSLVLTRYGERVTTLRAGLPWSGGKWIDAELGFYLGASDGDRGEALAVSSGRS